jgi:hypothetical protein
LAARRSIDPYSTKILKIRILPGGFDIFLTKKETLMTTYPPVNSPVQSADKQQKSRRAFRRLRWQFKQDLGLETLTSADRLLIDQCALLALRARQMRDDILDGEKVINDEDLVRNTNACIRAMSAIGKRAVAKPEQTQDELIAELYGKDFNRDQ